MGHGSLTLHILKRTVAVCPKRVGAPDSSKHKRCSRACLPTVLIPGLDLRFGEVKTFGDVCSVGDAQIFLTAEFPLEVLQLGVSERRSSTS